MKRAQVSAGWQKIIAVALGLMVLFFVFIFVGRNTALGGILPSFVKGLFPEQQKCDETSPQLKKDRDAAFAAYDVIKVKKVCERIAECYPGLLTELKPKGICECREDSYYTDKISTYTVLTKEKWNTAMDNLLVSYLGWCMPSIDNLLKVQDQMSWLCYDTRYAIYIESKFRPFYKDFCRTQYMKIGDAYYTKAQAETDSTQRALFFSYAATSYERVWRNFPTDFLAWWQYVYSGQYRYGENDRNGYVNTAFSVDEYQKYIGSYEADNMIVYLGYNYFKKFSYADNDASGRANQMETYIEKVANRDIAENKPMSAEGMNASIMLANRYYAFYKNDENARIYYFTVFRRDRYYPGAELGLLNVADAYVAAKDLAKAQSILSDMLLIYRTYSDSVKTAQTCTRIKQINPSYTNNLCPTV